MKRITQALGACCVMSAIAGCAASPRATELLAGELEPGAQLSNSPDADLVLAPEPTHPIQVPQSSNRSLERRCDNGVVASFHETVDYRWNPTDSCGVFKMRLESDSGAVLQEIQIQRKSRRVSHAIPYPDGRDIVVSDAARRIIFRVNEGLMHTGGESWWIFDEDRAGLICVALPLSFEPHIDTNLSYIADVVALPTAPFVVVSYCNDKICAGDRDLSAADRVVLLALEDFPRVVWSSLDEPTLGRDAACFRLVVDKEQDSFRLLFNNGSRSAWSVSSAGAVSQIASK